MRETIYRRSAPELGRGKSRSVQPTVKRNRENKRDTRRGGKKKEREL